MDILVNVANQKLKIATNLKSLVAGTQEFVRFTFNLTGDWDDLMTFAQFQQNGVAYNAYLDENNSAYLPSEIGVGTCTLMLYGSNDKTIATTNYLTLTIDENIIVSDANSTEISESLYTQLVTKVNTLLTWNEQNAADLQAVDKDLQIQINNKAAQKDLTAEIARAKQAEKANADAIALKASQKEVDELSIKVTQLESNEVIASLIEAAVVKEMEEYLAAGTLANLTIADGSITRSKVDSAFNDILTLAETAMQPSVYDKLGRKVDVFDYAQSRADTVQNNLNKVKEEIQGAYVLTDDIHYTNLGDALRGAITLSRNYAQALLSDYKAFTIEFVDELPLVGEPMIFYLIPKESGDGYDKYWWIVDDNGDAKWDMFGGTSTLVVSELPAEGEEDIDYILKSSSGCLYYKWIDGYWEVIAGSIAYVSATLPNKEQGNEFTDYYVVDSESGSYIHYRFINGDFHMIGGNSYTKDEINAKISLINESISNNAKNIDANSEDITSLSTNISSLSQTVDKIRSDVDNIDTEGYTYYHTITKNEDTGNYVLTLYQVKGSDEEIASQTTLPATGGGGGGGSTTTTTVTVERVTASPLIITSTDKAEVEINFSSVDEDGETFDATYTWKSGSTILLTGALVQGKNVFDLSDFVSVGTQKFTLTVVDEAGTTVVKSWTIQKVDVRIESSFSDRYTTPIGRSVSFTYTPYGSVNKTVHFKVDGVEETITTSASGTLQSYTIPAKPHGSHLLEVWITATINNTEVETNHIFKDIIWYDENSEDAVIGCIYRSDYYSEARDDNDKEPGKVYARQYDTTAIAYNVFDPNTSSPTVNRYVDGELVGTDTISSSYNVWNFKSDEVGTFNLEIEVGSQSVTIVVVVEELGIDVSPITANLEVDFNPTGITNSSADRVWSNGNYNMSVSDNFDWANGGYKVDEKGDTYFLVKAGTHAIFDYKLFSGGIDGNPSVLGSEMKIIFKTENVQDANAVWLTSVENGMGLQMSVHEGWLKTNTASNTDIEGDENTDSVAATNTYLYMPYSEEDIIEMDINIDPIDRDDSTAKAFVMAYEDGVPSKAFVYDGSDRFYQYTPQPIKIGSTACDVRIYRLKIYSSSLTTEDVMKNFIADSRDSTTMLARYDRNSIYYNRETNKYTPYSSGGILDPEKLAPIIPNVKVLMLETDHFTTSKKTFVKSKFRCIHASGGGLFSGDPYLDNWLFENGYHSGQGTTSDNYGNSGRNVDFLFNCDGTHKPSDKVSAEEGYVSQVTLGYGTENAMTEVVTDWKGDEGKVALTRTSVPNNFFNLKVNVASSENVNNALLQKRFNDFLPYISPAKKRDSKIKNSMEFVPAVLFLKETNPDPSTHNEFLDCEWHFYALGNIGDSKKTDYTRAYDPEDMNEFVLEISDNTKNNATFQSGVYLDENGNRQIEKFTITETEDDGDIILTPVSTDKPQSFVYPITRDEWENENNMRHWCMYNEGFDGDHSFEPRYACCGDYRDGKLVNDTSGRGKAQVELNNNVWRAFYRWVITSTDDEFKNELDQWCVRSAVEFFYAFTHIYTMMDNRAKNTFWHFAKTGVYREVSKPVSELLHIYCELIDGEYVTTTDTEIDSGKTYYTQYAFDLWDYDNDTALGINNNGELIFPYGKEDTDYNIDGNPASGYVFNGATSVFWCRLRDLLPGEITTTFQTVAAECFSADNLINQFDDYQECYPEEIWRLDIQRKYIRTFTGESIDNSKPKHDVQYLRDMMQGRKKYQRRQWVRDQEIYFGTKNLMNTVVGDDNRITFRCFTPTGDDIVVQPDYTLKIVPYSDMYLSVMFGNGGTQQVRAKGGTEYTIECPLATMDDTQVTIYGANRIQALSDLSACYIAANNFSMADKLRKLVLGNTTPGYNNSRLVSLTLGKNELLEELDIRNCKNLTGSINLAECNNLLKLYAEGTSLTGVTFATNGKVQIAHLPNTINTLTMRNLNNLVDFQATLEALENLTLQGGTLDSLEIINNCIDTLQVLYLYDIDWTGSNSLADTTLLNQLHSLFYSMITGKAYVSGQIRNQELVNYEKSWKDLEVTYNPDNLVTQYPVTYVNADDKMTVLFTTYVDRGSTPPDPYAEGWIEKPTKESDSQYTYSFGTETDGVYDVGSGWDDLTGAITAPKTITAVYTENIRKYTVTWYSRAGLSLGSVEAEYGSEVVYSGTTPVNTTEEGILIYNVFAGWDKSTGFIKEDTDVYAVWERAELPAVGKSLEDMTEGEIFAITSAGKAADYFESKDHFDLSLGHDFNFSNVESEVIAENLYLDGSTAKDTGVYLFGENEKSFTMAIDFTFTNTSATNATLLSCYEEDGAEGFRLRYSGAPDIQWGDTNFKVGNGKYRDIVVLRHRKGENKLYVYCSNGNNSSSFADAISRTELTRNRSTSTEAPVTLGAIKFLGDGGHDYYGTGVIHWCKVWYDDLGETNAKALAAWYHEPFRIEFCGSGRYRLPGNTSQKVNASFIANNLLAGRGHYMNSTNTNVGGWDACSMRQFVNNRFFAALPTVWQSMIKPVAMKASAGNKSTQIITSEDKIYLVSYVEVGASTTDSTYLGEAEYGAIDFFTSNTKRVKFRGRIIPEDATFYSAGSDPSTVSTNSVKEGDVWINTGNQSIGYIYVSQEELDMYNLTPDYTASVGGGWISAHYWWERSPNISSTTNFMNVNTNGNPNNNNNASNVNGVCP